MVAQLFFSAGLGGHRHGGGLAGPGEMYS